MKKIEAIVRTERAATVKDALAGAGYPALTMYDVHGRGEQKGIVKTSRGREHRIDLLPKTKMEMVVEDRDVDRVLDIIVASARTGAVGDGRIFVLPVERSIRIRTGENTFSDTGAPGSGIGPVKQIARQAPSVTT